jgi:hypothetical protein
MEGTQMTINNERGQLEASARYAAALAEVR